MQGSRQRGEREAIARDQPIRARGDRAVNDVVGSTNNGRRTQLAHRRAGDHRTVSGIQEKIIEKRGRSLVSRLANGKNDKERYRKWRGFTTILQAESGDSFPS